MDGRMTMTAVAAGAALAIACGGGGGGPSIVRSTGPIGSADPATIRGLLAQYAPSGHAIVTIVEAMPERFELPEGAVTLTTDDTFDKFLRDGALEMLVTYTSTAVHELTHFYTSRMAYQLLAERRLKAGLGAQAILTDGEPHLVHFTATFPAAELDPTFPADARTFRYGVYITSPAANQGTQVQGIYGLLDELAAYYQDARVTLGFWSWVRDVAPADTRVIMNYAVLLDDVQRAHAEFTLYSLHYLRHAREHRPEVHAAIMANPAFRVAFLDVHDRYAALVETVRALEPEVHAFAATRGVGLARHDHRLVIDGNPQLSDQAGAIRATFTHVASDSYRRELAALR